MLVRAFYYAVGALYGATAGAGLYISATYPGWAGILIGSLVMSASLIACREHVELLDMMGHVMRCDEALNRVRAVLAAEAHRLKTEEQQIHEEYERHPTITRE